MHVSCMMPKSRAKSRLRRTKYLSLRRHLAPPPSPPPTPAPAEPLDFSSVLPDPDRDAQVASLLFSSTNGAETLTEILGAASDSAGRASGSPGSPPVGPGNGEDGDGLARRALRGRQREEYCCCSSSSSSSSEATVAGRGLDLWRGVPQPSPLLKLDYEEILAAWSDRGSLFIDGDTAQLLPHFHLHHAAFPVSSFPSSHLPPPYIYIHQHILILLHLCN